MSEHFTKATTLNPNDALAYVGLGNAWERRGEFDRAEAAYRKVIAIAPRNPIGHNNLAYLYASSGRDLKEALNAAQRARALAPSEP